MSSFAPIKIAICLEKLRQLIVKVAVYIQGVMDMGAWRRCEWLKIRITRTMVDHSLCVLKEIILAHFGNGVMSSKVSSLFANII